MKTATLKTEGNLAETAEESAEMLNKQFTSVFTMDVRYEGVLKYLGRIKIFQKQWDLIKSEFLS